MESEPSGAVTEPLTGGDVVAPTTKASDELTEAFEDLVGRQLARVAELNEQLASLRVGRGLPPLPPSGSGP